MNGTPQRISQEAVTPRRVSPRIKDIPEDKKPHYRETRKRSFAICSKRLEGSDSEQENGPTVMNAKAVESNNKSNKRNSLHRSMKSEEQCLAMEPKVKGLDSANVESPDKETMGCRARKVSLMDGGSSLVCDVLKSDYAKVKKTLRTFNTYYLHFVQEEEKRCEKLDGSKVKSSKPKEKVKEKAKEPNKAANKKLRKDAKVGHKRPDLKAISKMLEMNEVLYPEKRFGHLAGIDAGYQFFSRAEMVVIGFHSHWLNGIDYMGMSYKKKVEYKSYTFPLAVSVVLSGQYEDDLDNSDDIVYTGQGGNDLLGKKHQVEDQVMKRGNLALKHSKEQSIPVRVVRGHACTSSYCGKVYTYDGLYKVIDYWPEKGVSGFTVFKYRLKRLDGQSALTTNQVHFIRGGVAKLSSELRGLVCKDISGGQEVIPIPATNLFDDPPVPPLAFIYAKGIQISRSIDLPHEAIGCQCKGECSNPKICACAKLNGGDFPYVHRNGGRLIEAKDVVYECGPRCGCGPSCLNRVSQRSLRYHLEVFRTPEKGWAVRSWDFIPSGAPVCEYTGMVRRNDELDHVSENDYIFDIDCWQTMNEIGGRERRCQNGSMPSSNGLDATFKNATDSTPEFCIDAGSMGSISRFINHSCEPNLFVQCVLSSHHDVRLARVVLFAADNIPPMQELAYDYGYVLDSVVGEDGKVKQLPCHCGASGCRKRLY